MKPFFLKRLSRRLVGPSRPPVSQASMHDLKFADITLAFTAGACSMAIVVMVLVAYFWRPSCG